MSRVIQFTQVDYPESDGKPMGETDEHRQEMVRHVELLTEFYRGQRVYVSGDLLVYYEQGNPRKFVVPDAFIAKGLTPGPRRVYKVWVEGKVPDLVIETTSRKTRRKDTLEKPELYARLGVREYFLFDPHQEYLDPPLQGHRLDGTAFVPIAPAADGSLVSQELAMRLRIGDGHLQFYRLDNGEKLLTHAERAEQESQRAEQESQRAEHESRRAEQESRRAERERQRAEQETRRAEIESQRAEREAEGRRAAEAELERLRQELARRPPG